ncbi:hypothetical protein, partial [Stenotrophomonas indicatrix]|uniref:hypothetical protein n=1 Tax=Stenotrophomonas indicatrix TaxID=2045451 RepID=UPI0019684C72
LFRDIEYPYTLMLANMVEPHACQFILANPRIERKEWKPVIIWRVHEWAVGFFIENGLQVFGSQFLV